MILKCILRRKICSTKLDIAGSRWLQIAGCCISGIHPSDCTYTHVYTNVCAHAFEESKDFKRKNENICAV